MNFYYCLTYFAADALVPALPFSGVFASIACFSKASTFFFTGLAANGLERG